MKIETIRLRNFKVFQDVVIREIPSFCVVVGANGSGKTTLFDVFHFLKDCLVFNVTSALQSRGGFREVVSREHGSESIEIEIQFRTLINKADRLVTYLLEIAQDDKGRPVVEREILRYKRGAHGSPFHFLDYQRGNGFAITNEEDFDKAEEQLRREEQSLNSTDTLAIKGVGQFQRFKAANAFRQFIENWNVSDFHINLALGSKDVAGYSEHLSTSGDNLQLAANYLYENYRPIFDLILEKMRRRIPGMGKVTPEATADGRLLLKFQDGSFHDPFIKYVSDGTIKMFAYLVLLHDPNPHPLLCVEEPENQLYPKLLVELAEEFREYARRGGQVFVSTHSPDFLNATQLEEVIWLSKQAGYSQIRRAKDDPQLQAFMKAGDQMGYLWKEGFFEGADPR